MSYEERQLVERARIKRIISLVAVGIIAIIGLLSLGSIVENVDAGEILVVQDAMDGDLHVHTTPGVKSQWFGKTSYYPQRGTYDFVSPIKFFDGGHGTMKGSIQYEMPTAEPQILTLHNKFRGSAESIKTELIETITDKAIYMTGPLMSSRESYAEKRNDLIRYIEDQIAHGVYRTSQTEVKVADILTGQEKTALKVELVNDATGNPARQEDAVLSGFGIRTFNFSIESLDYDERVEAQISEQQKLAMSVQTSIAEARKAEQQKLTVEQQGAADAAKARWEQEVIKAKEVTAAEQRLQVAELDRQTAEVEKQRQILDGQGIAERKRLILAADGALAQKLDAYIQVQKAWAENIPKYTGAWVPTVVQGGDNKSGQSNAAQDMMNLLGIKAARDLGLDLNVKGHAANKDQ